MRIVHPRWSKQQRARLRMNMTRAERIFWYYIRHFHKETSSIRRQVVIGRFIVDFLHAKSKTIIEIDG
jgi:very-short-patch-repair endonuclease